jgi:CRP/FNR family transcriptional regulator, nitrogen fixation regulation protein
MSMNSQRLQPVADSDTMRFNAAFSLPGVRMSFERSEEIFGEGEPADYLYQVKSGAVRTIRFSNHGCRQILAFHLPGDIFGLEFGETHGFSAEAMAGAEVVLVRRLLLENAAGRDSHAARALLQITQQTLRDAREHALLLARKGAGERVAAFLLLLGRRFVNSQEIDLPMSRADIGDFLGLTIESVSRAFSDMEQKRTIALPSSRHVVMRNRHALMQLEAA